MSSKEILVSIALGSENIRIGKLWFHVRGHKKNGSFEYDKEWLDLPKKFALEPAEVLKNTIRSLIFKKVINMR